MSQKIGDGRGGALPAPKRDAEEVSEEELTRSFNLGRSSGLDAASKYMLKEAADLFARGQDELAMAFRRQSKELARLAEEARPENRSSR